MSEISRAAGPFILGASVADARSACGKLGIPVRRSETIRARGGAFHGWPGRGLVVFVTPAAAAELERPRLRSVGATRSNLMALMRAGATVWNAPDLPDGLQW